MPSFSTPSNNIRRLSGKALADFKMTRENDRILVAVSGGKDSLTLLHTLLYFQQCAPINFQVGAITIDPQSPDFDPSPLRDYIPSLGVEYHYVSEPILDLAQDHMGKDSFCAFCSRMRRGLMYKTARQQGFNVLAMGQHLDDLAESFLMSAFHGGQLRTMKAHYQNDEGDIRVIRPFVYVRERLLRDFAEHQQLPVIIENCPACFGAPSERQQMKKMLAEQEQRYPNTFKSLQQTLHPLMREGLPEDA